jgi:S-methylmethionine transporter
MLWSLGNEGTIPHIFTKTGRNGVPTLALLASMLGGILALISSKVAASTVYLVLVSISGLAVVIVWMAIAWSELNFRRRFIAEGHSLTELKYRTPLFPLVPYFAFGLSALSCILIWFDPTQHVALYYTIPFVAFCYLVHYLWQRKAKNNK